MVNFMPPSGQTALPRLYVPTRSASTETDTQKQLQQIHEIHRQLERLEEGLTGSTTQKPPTSNQAELTSESKQAEELALQAYKLPDQSIPIKQSIDCSIDNRWFHQTTHKVIYTIQYNTVSQLYFIKKN